MTPRLGLSKTTLAGGGRRMQKIFRILHPGWISITRGPPISASPFEPARCSWEKGRLSPSTLDSSGHRLWSGITTGERSLWLVMLRTPWFLVSCFPVQNNRAGSMRLTYPSWARAGTGFEQRVEGRRSPRRRDQGCCGWGKHFDRGDYIIRGGDEASRSNGGAAFTRASLEGEGSKYLEREPFVPAGVEGAGLIRPLRLQDQYITRLLMFILRHWK